MKTHDDIAERLTTANPAPTDTELPDLMWDSATLLEVIDRRGALLQDPSLGVVSGRAPSLPPVRPERRRWRPTWVAVTAAVVTLVLLGGFVLLRRPDTAPGPVASFGPNWTPVSTDNAVFGSGAVMNVIAIPDGFLAVGEHLSIWHSTDGAEWTRVFADPAGDPRPSANTTLFDAAENDLGYLAVGRTPHVWFNEPVFAFSADGVVWERFGPLPRESSPTDDPEGILLDTDTPLSVVATDDAFLVAAQSCELGGPSMYDCRGVVWRSEDGLNWTRVMEDVRDSAFESIERVDDRFLAVGGMGVGLNLQSQGNEAVRVWSSFDGITWTDVSPDPSVFDADRPDHAAREYAQAVTAVDGGFVVVGSRLDVPEGAIWFSADATTWMRVPTHDLFDHATINGIAASDDQVIAVGAVGSTAAAWRSDDGGRTWERMDIDPALTGDDSRFLAVAIRGDAAVAGLSVDDRAAIWAVDLVAEP